MFKLSTIRRALVGAAVCAIAMSAQAAETYGDIGDPGVVFGSGNVNGNFTISKQNGVELALRIKNFGGATIDGSSGVYTTSTGLVAGRPANKPRALWNYEFTINATEGALTGLTYQLMVDDDPTAGVHFNTVDVLANYNDNAGDGVYIFQNSQNVIFGNTPGGAFDPNAAGLYDFRLVATGFGGRALVNSVDIQVDVVDPNATVPEPGSIALLGLGMAGFLAARKRRKSK